MTSLQEGDQLGPYIGRPAAAYLPGRYASSSWFIPIPFHWPKEQEVIQTRTP